MHNNILTSFLPSNDEQIGGSFQVNVLISLWNDRHIIVESGKSLYYLFIIRICREFSGQINNVEHFRKFTEFVWFLMKTKDL
jgi:hypothetical protein